jgi:oxalate decarboxylase
MQHRPTSQPDNDASNLSTNPATDHTTDPQRRNFLAGVAAMAGAAGVSGSAGLATSARASFGDGSLAPRAASNSHAFRLSTLAPQLMTPSGSRTHVTAREFPALRGMSFYKLAIERGSFREPHWHSNADELGYCTAGEVLITMFSSGNKHDVFRVKAGEMYLVPSGAFHAIENIGDVRAEIMAAFSHEEPEDFGLSGAVGCMSREVMGNTWDLDVASLANLARSTTDLVFGKTDGRAEVPSVAEAPNKWKFAVEASQPPIVNDYGSVRVARLDTWPHLRSLSMYSLRVEGIGMREPHWHPETAEMGYVLQGRSRMTVKSPASGARSVDTYELGPGDLYFIPKAYPHVIENLGSDELRFLIFFDRPMPEDIGYTGGIPAFPRRLVAPSLATSTEALPRYPERTTDAMIVRKRNPTGG